MSVSLEIVSQQVIELRQHLLLLFLDFMAGILGRKTLTGAPRSLLRGWGRHRADGPTRRASHGGGGTHPAVPHGKRWEDEIVFESV